MRLGAVCPGDERCLLCFMHVASIFPVIALLIYLFFRSKITRKKLLKKKKFLCHIACFSTLWLWPRSWQEKYNQNTCKIYPPVHIWIWSVCHNVDGCLGVFPRSELRSTPCWDFRGMAEAPDDHLLMVLAKLIFSLLTKFLDNSQRDLSLVSI